MTKRTISFLLTILILLCSVACKKQETSTNTTTEAAKIEKPKSITVMWDDTMPTDDGKAETFAKELSKELGIEIRLITPNNASYYDVLESSFASETVPDVFVLSADKYVHYAKTGALWDMKEAWDNSELKASGRLKDWAINRLSTLEIEGKDKRKGMYGFSIERGYANATIVRTAWLEECNLNPPKNYEEFLNMCNAFRDKYSCEPMFTMPSLEYAVEFSQGANLDFCKNAEGKWVDGFAEQKTKDAFLRTQKANQAGLLKPYYGGMGEKNDFAAGDYGIRMVDYDGLMSIVKRFETENISDSRITILEPINETGCYYEKQSYVLAISNKVQNPEGIFKYFIEPIYDGGKVQSLWTYGVQGVHWDYKDGNLEGYNVINPMLSLGRIDADKDPAKASKTPAVPEIVEKFNEVLNKSGKTEPVMYDNSGIKDYIDRINESRNRLYTDVVANGKSIEDAYKEYDVAVGQYVEECLRILNE